MEQPRRPGRPKGPSLTPARIGEATIRLLERGDAVTFSNVAVELNVRSQTLYHHAHTVGDLHDFARGTLIPQVDISPLEHRVSADTLVLFTESYFDAFRPVATSFGVLFLEPIRDPATLELYERFLVALTAHGIGQQSALLALFDVEYAVQAAFYELTFLTTNLSVSDAEASTTPTLRTALEQFGEADELVVKQRLRARIVRIFGSI